MSEPTAPHADARGRVPLIIGLGNEHRGDDGSGLHVARALKSRLAGRARVEECTTEGIALLELWRDADRVLVIDAVRSGAVPGTIHRFEVGDGFSPGVRPVTSTHGLSLVEAVALGRGLGCLPRELVIYGIEADIVTIGDGLTGPVARAVEETTERIVGELASAPGRGTSGGRPPHA